MADGKQFEYGQSASEVQFQDEIGKLKNRQGEAVLEVNDDQQIFLKSSEAVKITTFIDDDTMGTAAATSLATSESIKAYVDASGGGSGSFDDITVDTSTLVANVSGYTDKVGIGTATPDRTLEVLDDTNPQLRLTHTDGTEYVEIQSKATGDAAIEMTDSNMWLRSGDGSCYLMLQNTTTGKADVTTEGLVISTSGRDAGINMHGFPSKLWLGVNNGWAIKIDSTNNTTAVLNLVANGNVTLGDAGTDEHTLNGTLNLDSSPDDLTCSGTTASFVAGEDLDRGEVVYYKPADSSMWKAIATATATSRAVAIAAEDIGVGNTGRFLLRGFLKDTGTLPTFVAGDVIYTDEGTGGAPTKTAPSTTGDFVQIIGWAVDPDTIYFDPDSTIIEIA